MQSRDCVISPATDSKIERTDMAVPGALLQDSPTAPQVTATNSALVLSGMTEKADTAVALRPPQRPPQPVERPRRPGRDGFLVAPVDGRRQDRACPPHGRPLSEPYRPPSTRER